MTYHVDRVRKRLPVRPHGGTADIYVTRDVRFGSLVSRAMSLLKRGSEARLHALGAALQRCVDVALAVQKAAGPDTVVLSPTTSTVIVIDDYEPIVPGYPARTRKRAKNALQIVISPLKNFV